MGENEKAPYYETLGRWVAMQRLAEDGSRATPLFLSVEDAKQALRAGGLTKDANKQRQLLDVFHSFHAACMLHFMTQWKRRGLTIQDFGFLRKEIETLATKKPAKLLQARVSRAPLTHVVGTEHENESTKASSRPHPIS